MDEKDKVINLGRVKVSLPQLLDSIGQSIYITARMAATTDPNQAYAVFLSRLELIENAALVLRGLYEQLDQDWDGYYVRLPRDIAMVRVANPLNMGDIEIPLDNSDDISDDLGGMN